MNVTPTTGIRHIELSADRRSARRARAFVHDTLEQWKSLQLENEVALAVSELVTNAIIHANSEVSVTLVHTDDGVQIRVRDDQPEPPTIRYVTLDETGGRGLSIVEALSDQWGVEPAPPGKVIWLDITEHQEP